MAALPKLRPIVLMVLVVLAVSTTSSYLWETDRERLILATTTSTYDSGLLDELIPTFEDRYHVYVDIISVGTGQAIATAAAGDADVILVHSKSAELAFIEGKHGYHRVGVMYNDFVVVGPSTDPANIRGSSNVTEAYHRIRNIGNQGACFFVSRGDNSGTYKKEQSIWTTTGVVPSGEWYLESGQGMGSTIQMANEKQAYTMTDRGTWLSWTSMVTLEILTEGDLTLLNPYGGIPVNPAKHPHVNSMLATKFVQFLVSTETQQMIQHFKKDGEILFKPIARDVPLSISLGFPNQEQELDWYDSQ